MIATSKIPPQDYVKIDSPVTRKDLAHFALLFLFDLNLIRLDEFKLIEKRFKRWVELHEFAQNLKS